MEGDVGEEGKLARDSTSWATDGTEGAGGEVGKLARDLGSWQAGVGGVGLDWEGLEMHPVRSMGGDLTGECGPIFVAVESFDTLGLLRMLLGCKGLVLTWPSKCTTS